MTAASTLTREQLDANPMLESTRVESSGTMTGFNKAQIAESDLPMVMKLLTRAYTRPHEAVVRELVANALDSHRDAGVTDPVQVTLPTMDAPSLTVTDCGLGLSSAEFSSVFGNVGASTKRQSLTSTGHMGIGSKSPYAIADQYQVAAVKDGSMIQALFAKTDEGIPSSKILFEGPTDKPNGVSITVPVDLRHLNTLQQAAHRALFWRNRGEVEVTNLSRPLDHWNDEGNLYEEYRTEKVMLADHQAGLPVSRVRMGGIGYEIPSTVLDDADIPSNVPLIFNLEPKAAIVAPSREALEDTDSLREMLARIYDEWIQSVKKELLNQLKQATSSIDFVNRWERMPSHLKGLANLSDVEYAGEKLGYTMSLDEVRLWSDATPKWMYGYARHRGQRNEALPVTVDATDFHPNYNTRTKEFIVIGAFTEGPMHVETPEFRTARRTAKAYERVSLVRHCPIVITAKEQAVIERFDDSGTFFIFRSLDETKALIPKKKPSPKRDRSEPIVFTRIFGKNRSRPATAANIDLNHPVMLTTKREFDEGSDYLAGRTTDEKSNELAEWGNFPFHLGTVLLRENRTDATVAKELGIKEDQVLDVAGFVDEIHRRAIESMSLKERKEFADSHVVAQVMSLNLQIHMEARTQATTAGKYDLSAANRRDITRLLNLADTQSHMGHIGNQGAMKRLLNHPKMPASKIGKQFPRTLDALSLLNDFGTREAKRFTSPMLAAILDADRADRARTTKGGDAATAS